MPYLFFHTMDPKNKFSRYNVQVEIPSDDLDLDEITEIMGDFLKACGYNFGNLMATPKEGDI